ncbi:hypothetical protein E2C01_100005 [Portunus trituberculatus]|uniref:Uncharacterized protein n=1 Tax=Portunus trituberculatus TaxID=210409 RepID=A0A5B7KIA9_PORTR|nr:hypothetical protein [Portunus trituberculatus]
MRLALKGDHEGGKREADEHVNTDRRAPRSSCLMGFLGQGGRQGGTLEGAALLLPSPSSGQVMTHMSHK